MTRLGMRKNFRVLESMWEKKITQCELVKKANISSEARLSRIINGQVMPDPEEIKRISEALGESTKNLGFSGQGK